jgi:pimeloyl-ACP methyl ester carboxylesterase
MLHLHSTKPNMPKVKATAAKVTPAKPISKKANTQTKKASTGAARIAARSAAKSGAAKSASKVAGAQAVAQEEGTISAPPLAVMALELRAPWEIGLGLLSLPLLSLPQAPRGDGHAVLVFPGLAANDATTALLRRFLDTAGFDAHGWELGFNRGPSNQLMQACRDKIKSLYDSTGGKISLVGWSLGGLYARELAKEMPKLVRCVVTLGTPFAADPTATNAGFVYNLLAGHDVKRAAADKDLALAPPVPTTSIYSKTDGIVAWQCSVQDATSHQRVENIEVQASHFGIGANPLAMYALADRLAQPEGDWQPFEKKTGVKKWLYRERMSNLDIL